jgi:hypothetical protein
MGLEIVAASRVVQLDGDGPHGLIVEFELEARKG